MNMVILKLFEVCPHCHEDLEVQFQQPFYPSEIAKTVTYSMICFSCKRPIVFTIEWPILKYQKMGE